MCELSEYQLHRFQIVIFFGRDTNAVHKVVTEIDEFQWVAIKILGNTAKHAQLKKKASWSVHGIVSMAGSVSGTMVAEDGCHVI